MDINYWIQIIISILSGIAVAIPLIIKLVDVVKKATKSKNWNLLIKMTIDRNFAIIFFRSIHIFRKMMAMK